MTSNEKTKLISGGNTSSQEPKSFYFLKSTKASNEDDTISSLDRRPSLASGKNSSPFFSKLYKMFQKDPNEYKPLNQKPRKVPVKIEPKVFFANERTFLAWLHMSVTLASISIAIVAFAEANQWSQIYGLLLMPVAIAFSAYSLWVYMKRASMIRKKDPGPYDDKVGPVLLASLLALSITVNFFVKLYDLAT